MKYILGIYETFDFKFKTLMLYHPDCINDWIFKINKFRFILNNRLKNLDHLVPFNFCSKSQRSNDDLQLPIKIAPSLSHLTCLPQKRFFSSTTSLIVSHRCFFHFSFVCATSSIFGWKKIIYTDEQTFSQTILPWERRLSCGRWNEN